MTHVSRIGKHHRQANYVLKNACVIPHDRHSLFGCQAVFSYSTHPLAFVVKHVDLAGIFFGSQVDFVKWFAVPVNKHITTYTAAMPDLFVKLYYVGPFVG